MSKKGRKKGEKEKFFHSFVRHVLLLEMCYVDEYKYRVTETFHIFS